MIEGLYKASKAYSTAWEQPKISNKNENMADYESKTMRILLFDMERTRTSSCGGFGSRPNQKFKNSVKPWHPLQKQIFQTCKKTQKNWIVMMLGIKQLWKLWIVVRSTV
jgi:hypothetical protein